MISRDHGGPSGYAEWSAAGLVAFYGRQCSVDDALQPLFVPPYGRGSSGQSPGMASATRCRSPGILMSRKTMSGSCASAIIHANYAQFRPGLRQQGERMRTITGSTSAILAVGWA